MIKYATRTLGAFATRTLLVSSALLLAACQQGEQAATRNGSSELDWARAALERNPQIEVIAMDSSAQVFTVRDAQSGEVHAVKLSELAAVPVSRLSAGSASPRANAVEETMPPTSAESGSEPASEGPPQATDDPSGEHPLAAARAPGSEDEGAPQTDYTIERSGSQVRISGPGVSIVSSGSAPTSRAQQIGNNAVEPIICEGRRMVHLDNREIYVDGDAILVRGGCEMFITNSRIAASGTGVVVLDGTVHVSNSHVEGAESSIDAGNNAKLFVRGSTFRGVSRRAEAAVVQDQGGNRWR